MELAIMERGTLPAEFGDWVEQGRALIARRDQVEWELVDWLADGKARYGTQLDFFDRLGDALGIAPKELRGQVKLADAFPPHRRDSSLTFAHHEAVAILPPAEAIQVLHRAKSEHLDDRETRQAALRRKAEIAPSLISDPDYQDAEYRDLVRRWNRASADTRQMLVEQWEETGLADIDL